VRELGSKPLASSKVASGVKVCGGEAIANATHNNITQMMFDEAHRPNEGRLSLRMDLSRNHFAATACVASSIATLQPGHNRRHGISGSTLEPPNQTQLRGTFNKNTSVQRQQAPS
ncbi:MAG: hypothetical protein ACLP3R_01285, partial [Candidatus Korobacteraceae bacterium]